MKIINKKLLGVTIIGFLVVSAGIGVITVGELNEQKNEPDKKLLERPNIPQMKTNYLVPNNISVNYPNFQKEKMPIYEVKEPIEADKDLNPWPQGPADLPNKSKAIEIAENYLKENNLYPQNVKEIKVVYQGGEKHYSNNDTSKSYSYMVTVSFFKGINGNLIKGVYGTTLVDIGEDGEIVDVLIKRLKIGDKYLEAPLKDPKTALKESDGIPVPKSLTNHSLKITKTTIEEIQIVYLANNRNQSYLHPVYEVSGQIKLNNGETQRFNTITEAIDYKELNK